MIINVGSLIDVDLSLSMDTNLEMEDSELMVGEFLAVDDQQSSLCTHGFRTTFRTYIANETVINGEIAEFALAHKLKDKAQAAYQQGNFLEKRRGIMQNYASVSHYQKLLVLMNLILGYVFMNNLYASIMYLRT